MSIVAHGLFDRIHGHSWSDHEPRQIKKSHIEKYVYAYFSHIKTGQDIGEINFLLKVFLPKLVVKRSLKFIIALLFLSLKLKKWNINIETDYSTVAIFLVSAFSSIR